MSLSVPIDYQAAGRWMVPSGVGGTLHEMSVGLDGSFRIKRDLT